MSVYKLYSDTKIRFKNNGSCFPTAYTLLVFSFTEYYKTETLFLKRFLAKKMLQRWFCRNLSVCAQVICLEVFWERGYLTLRSKNSPRWQGPRLEQVDISGQVRVSIWTSKTHIPGHSFLKDYFFRICSVHCQWVELWCILTVSSYLIEVLGCHPTFLTFLSLFFGWGMAFRPAAACVMRLCMWECVLWGKLNMCSHATERESLFQRCNLFSFCGSVGSLCWPPPLPSV